MGRLEMAEKHKNPATQGGDSRRVYSSGGRNRLPRLTPDRPKNGLKRPNSGFSGFEDFLSGFEVGS